MENAWAAKAARALADKRAKDAGEAARLEAERKARENERAAAEAENPSFNSIDVHLPVAEVADEKKRKPGRPSKGAQTVSLSLPSTLLTELDTARGPRGRSDWISEACREKLARYGHPGSLDPSIGGAS